MSKSEPKKILSEEEMKTKVEEAIRFYKTGKKDVGALYDFTHSILMIHNEACRPGREMAWITEFCASFPDN